MTRVIDEPLAEIDGADLWIAADLSGEPSAIRLPRLSTRIRSACSNTTSMSCSVKSTPIDCSRAIRAVSRISSIRSRGAMSGGRLVHQEKLRLVGERNREFEPLEIAIGKFAARTLGVGALRRAPYGNLKRLELSTRQARRNFC